MFCTILFPPLSHINCCFWHNRLWLALVVTLYLTKCLLKCMEFGMSHCATHVYNRCSLHTNTQTHPPFSFYANFLYTLSMQAHSQPARPHACFSASFVRLSRYIFTCNSVPIFQSLISAKISILIQYQHVTNDTYFYYLFCCV